MELSASAATPFRSHADLPGSTRRRSWSEAPLRVVRALSAVLAVAALLTALVVVFIGVIARYVLDDPQAWSDEVAQLMLVASAFLGAALAYARGDHLGLEIVRSRLHGSRAEAADAMVTWVVLAVALAMAVSTGALLPAVAGQTTAGGLPETLYYLPILVAGGLIALTAAVQLAASASRAVATGFAPVAAPCVLWLVWAIAAPGSTPAPLLLAVLVFAATAVIGVPVAFALAAGALTFYAAGGGLPIALLAQQMEAGSATLVLLAIPFFVLAGLVMEVNGMSTRLIALLLRTIGRLRGGLRVAMIVAMAVFSGISGSKSADVAAVGSVMVPVMREAGDDDGDAVGLLAATAVMGETIPPCINMIILGYVAGVSIGGLFIAGLIPALLIGIALTVVAVATAPRRQAPTDLTAPEIADTVASPQVGEADRDSAVADRAAEQPRDAGQLWLGASIGLLMIVLIVGGIVGGVATPTEVAAFAVVYAVVVGGLAFRELTVKGTVDWLVRSASMAGTILFIVAAAQALTYTLTVERVPQDIADWMTELAGTGTWLFILVSVVILIVMGSILEGAPALIIFGPLLLPVATELGVDPLHYGIVLVLSMGLGLFSPPVGLGAFTVCAVGRVPMERMIRPAAKYLAVVAIVLLLVAFWPALTTTLPDALGLSGLEEG